jgi:hypothetical protein
MTIFWNFILQDSIGEEIDDFLLNKAFEGTSPKGRVVAFFSEIFENLGVPIEGDLALLKAGRDFFELDSDDRFHVFEFKGEEGEDLIEAIEKFGAKSRFQNGIDDGEELFFGVGAFLEQKVRAEIRGHDEKGIFTIDFASFAIGDMSLIKDL